MGAQVVPVVVNGVMYVPAGNVVVAIDGATGKEVWRYTVTTGAASNRGVNYWAGNGTVGPRIVFTTRGQSGNYLVALDAATGKPSAGFGQNGITDLGSVGWSGVPVVFRNVLALGASTLETPQDAEHAGRHARLRRDHRQVEVDLSQRAAPRRSGSRDVAQRRVEGPDRAPTSGTTT